MYYLFVFTDSLLLLLEWRLFIAASHTKQSLTTTITTTMSVSWVSLISGEVLDTGNFIEHVIGGVNFIVARSMHLASISN